LKLTDADPAIQKAFALTYRSGPGHAVLEWIIQECFATRYSAGDPWELAVCQCDRAEFGELLKDITRRGLAIIESEERAAEADQQTPPSTPRREMAPDASGDGADAP
jgi:hypothetical protein